MTGAVVVRADAGRLPLPDGSVDLVVTSSPYFGQRLYTDAGVPIPGQLGAEPTPEQFLESLWAVAAELWRVLKPTGSVWWNLGDKRAGSGAPGTTSQLERTSGRGPGQRDPSRTGLFDSDDGPPGRPHGTSTLRGTHQLLRGAHPIQGARSGMSRGYTRPAFGRDKSKMLLPHRFAIGCEDGVADPCTRDHDHYGRHPALLRSEECRGIGWIVRQDQVWSKPNGMPEPVRDRTRDSHEYWFHLTKSGRYIADVDPLRTPPRAPADGAVFGGRRRNAASVVGSERAGTSTYDEAKPASPRSVWEIATEGLAAPEHLGVDHYAAFPTEWPRRLILGWSQPGAVVLDPFGGTGTTAMVARALGRRGISTDLSADYGRLARWRIFESDGASRVRTRTNGAAQPDLFGALT